MKSNAVMLALVLLTPILLIGFQNCGFNNPGFYVEEKAASFASQSLVLKEGCETKIMEKYLDLYKTTYHPFLSETCKRCHTAGPGSGLFAYPDPAIAGTHFISRFQKINRNAINPTHANEIADVIRAKGQAGQEAFIQSLSNQWTAAYAEYVKCSDIPGPGLGIITTGKSNSAILANAGNQAVFTPIEWNLMTDILDNNLRNKLSITLRIEVRAAKNNGKIDGYEFRNPSARLNMPSAPPLNLKGIRIYINNTHMSDVSTYVLVNKNVTTDLFTNLSPDTAYALAVTPAPVAASDLFAVEVAAIADATGAAVEPTPPVTQPGVTLPANVFYTQLVSFDPNLGIFQQVCSRCHNAVSASGGGPYNILDPVEAKARAAKIKARTRDATNPMPPTGLLNQYSQDIIRIWVDGGAN